LIAYDQPVPDRKEVHQRKIEGSPWPPAVQYHPYRYAVALNERLFHLGLYFGNKGKDRSICPFHVRMTNAIRTKVARGQASTAIISRNDRADVMSVYRGEFAQDCFRRSRAG
jgi:hypothetical protein